MLSCQSTYNVRKRFIDSHLLTQFDYRRQFFYRLVGVNPYDVSGHLSFTHDAKNQLAAVCHGCAQLRRIPTAGNASEELPAFLRMCRHLYGKDWLGGVEQYANPTFEVFWM